MHYRISPPWRSVAAEKFDEPTRSKLPEVGPLLPFPRLVEATLTLFPPSPRSAKSDLGLAEYLILTPPRLQLPP